MLEDKYEGLETSIVHCDRAVTVGTATVGIELSWDIWRGYHK